MVKRLPLAQVVIPGSWDEVLHWAPHREPASPSAYVSASLCITDREREAETKSEGEAGFMQGARCGTQSWVSRITAWAEGGAKLLSHPGCPINKIFKKTSRLGKSIDIYRKVDWWFLRTKEKEEWGVIALWV